MNKITKTKLKYLVVETLKLIEERAFEIIEEGGDTYLEKCEVEADKMINSLREKGYSQARIELAKQAFVNYEVDDKAKEVVSTSFIKGSDLTNEQG